jgi:hypothetical protein
MNTDWDARELKRLRVATAIALGHNQVPADESLIADLVMGVLDEHTCWNTYSWADSAIVLASHYVGEAAAHLKAIGKTHKPTTRSAAIHFLGRIGSGREIPLLTRCLYDVRDAVRIAAARGLARIRPSAVLPYLLDDGNFLLPDTAISRVRILAELRRGPPQTLSTEEHASVRQKLLEVLARPDVSLEEQIEAARTLKAEFPFGTLLRALFDGATD